MRFFAPSRTPSFKMASPSKKAWGRFYHQDNLNEYENSRKILKNIYVCTGHGKLSFPLINKVLFVIGSEFCLKSGFELMMMILIKI